MGLKCMSRCKLLVACSSVTGRRASLGRTLFQNMRKKLNTPIDKHRQNAKCTHHFTNEVQNKIMDAQHNFKLKFMFSVL